MDVSAIHTSSPSFANAELKAVGQAVNVASIAAAFELPASLRVNPSPSLLKREAEKYHKYSRLITVAQRQTKEKKRLQTPVFSPFYSFGLWRSITTSYRTSGLACFIILS